MNILKIKDYLKYRINASDILNLPPEEFEKFAKTAFNILNMLFDGADELSEDNLSMLIGEQMIFLFKSNIDLNLFYEYNGLTSFDIAGAVKGSVDYSNFGSLTSPLLKAYANSLGLIPKIEFDSNHRTAFAKV